jgi:hypothetical protein
LILRDPDNNAGATHGLAQRVWVLQDSEGNFSSLLDGSGMVAGRFVYGPHGDVERGDAAWGTAGAAVTFDYLHGTQRFHARGEDAGHETSRNVQSDRPVSLGVSLAAGSRGAMCGARRRVRSG